MLAILLATAFIAGLLVSMVRLPPMVGFLLAGFALHAIGFETSTDLQQVADLGVTLLLFTIGLKLDVRGLLAREVWATASLHMGLSVVLFSLLLALVKFLGLQSLSSVSMSSLLLLGFALSFSSTVLAVKLLEEKGEMQSLYGRVAIGILIMQDIFAVVFLTFTKGEPPSPWAILLLGLPLIRPGLHRLLERAGHGEMLVLYGLATALLLGPGLFGIVGMKPDLGALIVGMLIAGHPRANELAKSLFSLKELMLIAFFLNIGLTALPDWSSIALAGMLVLLLPIKSGLFFLLLTRFRLRARTASYSTITLSNYSEFGLIVTAIGVSQGWIGAEWLVALAIALSLSFLLATPLNVRMVPLYHGLRNRLIRFQSPELLSEDRYIDPGEVKFIVFGMGRIGTGVYQRMAEQHGESSVLGIENQPERVDEHVQAGRRVISGDATDGDFWTKLSDTSSLKAVFLAMPHHHGNFYAAEQLRQLNFDCDIAAIVQYPDEEAPLRQLGVDVVFNIYQEAGAGFAEHVCETLELASMANAEAKAD